MRMSAMQLVIFPDLAGHSLEQTLLAMNLEHIQPSKQVTSDKRPSSHRSPHSHDAGFTNSAV